MPNSGQNGGTAGDAGKKTIMPTDGLWPTNADNALDQVMNGYLYTSFDSPEAAAAGYLQDKASQSGISIQTNASLAQPKA